jgi:integrase
MGAMDSASAAKSIDLLIQVLNGKTYREIAGAVNLSRSAVEKRIKVIDLAIRATVGVAGLNDRGQIALAEMRKMKAAYLNAIDRFRPAIGTIISRDKRSLADQEIDHLVAVTQRRSSSKKRDVALVYIIFATGIKPLEIARLQVSDYLNEDGSVKVNSRLRRGVAVNGKARPLFFASAKLVTAIDAYLAERRQRGFGIKDNEKYRGLDPESRLFLTDDGQEMTVRVKTDGKHKHHMCTLILDIYRKIFQRADLKGVSAMSARRTFAQKLSERRCDLEEIGEALGIKDRKSVKNLIQKSPEPLHRAIRELV